MLRIPVGDEAAGRGPAPDWLFLTCFCSGLRAEHDQCCCLCCGPWRSCDSPLWSCHSPPLNAHLHTGIVERKPDLENPAPSPNCYMITGKLHKPMSVDLLTQSIGPMLALSMLWDHRGKTQLIQRPHARWPRLWGRPDVLDSNLVSTARHLRESSLNFSVLSFMNWKREISYSIIVRTNLHNT